MPPTLGKAKHRAMRGHLPLSHPKQEARHGAGLRALALVAGGWVLMRAMFIIGDDGEVTLRPFPPEILADKPKPMAAPQTPWAATTPHHSDGWARPVFPRAQPAATLPKGVAWIMPVAALPLAAVDAPFGLADEQRDYMGQLGPLFFAGSTAQMPDGSLWRETEIAPAAPLWLPPSMQSAHADGPFGLYAYLFYRPDAAPGASATTYGGSQMFVRADYRLGRGGLAGRSALYARASRDLGQEGRAEFALGGAVQPFAALPITLHGERRVRQGGPDAIAAFVSGGVTDVALPHGVRLNAYGQGGKVWPDKGKGSAFFDGQASLTKPVHRADNWRLDAGAMAATGGQDAAARLDIGPVVTLSAGKGRAQVQGQVGWRFRVAGDAAPAHGPAVTLSFGF